MLVEQKVQSVEELFRRSYAPLLRTLTVVARGDTEAAADALQEAFAQAVVRWDKIASYDDPAGWVRRVAINRLLNHFRKTERGLRAQRRASTPEAVDPDHPEFDLAASFKKLPDRQRTAAALYYIEGMDVASIADAMGVATGTAKRHLFRARETLRDGLEVQS
jgi:RNA polymerase sigma-70 factor (ECF subfamily)